MEIIQAILAFLNDPVFKTMIIMAVTFVLRRNPTIFNEAVPFLTGVASILTTVVALLVGEPKAEPHAGLMLVQLAEHATQPWWRHLLTEAILPWLLGYGGQRAGDHTGAWLRAGGALTITGARRNGAPL